MQRRSSNGYRPAHQIDGELVLASLVRNQSAQPERLRMQWIDTQYPAIGRFGGFDSAGLVILHRCEKRLRELCHVLIRGRESKFGPIVYARMTAGKVHGRARLVTKLSHRSTTLRGCTAGSLAVAVTPVRSIVVTMLVSFTVSFAVMFWQREPRDATVVASNAPAPKATYNEAAAIRRPAPADRSAAEPATGPALSAPPGSSADQAAEPSAEPLPIAFHIRNRRDLNRIEGDIANITDKAMPITMRAVNAVTRATSEVQFELRPGEKKSYSSESGPYMQTNDQLIIQSPPYRDRVVQVP